MVKQIIILVVFFISGVAHADDDITFARAVSKVTGAIHLSTAKKTDAALQKQVDDCDAALLKAGYLGTPDENDDGQQAKLDTDAHQSCMSMGPSLWYRFQQVRGRPVIIWVKVE